MNRYNHTQRIIEHLIVTNNSNDGSKLGSNLNRHLMVALTGTDINRNEILKDLASLRREGFTMDVMVSDSGEEINDIHEIRRLLNPKEIYTEDLPLLREGYLEGYDGFLAPLITQNTAIKLSLGIQDQLIPRILWQALWQGKPVWMNFQDLLQYKGLSSKEPFLIEKLKGIIVELKKMGIKAYDIPFNIQEFKKAFENTNHGTKETKSISSQRRQYHVNSLINNVSNERIVITEKDILTSKPSNGEMVFPAGSIITPLAKDTAKTLGIKVIIK